MTPAPASTVTTPFPAWQLWIVLVTSAFVLHFAWEMVQMPLYASMRGLSTSRVLATCGRATLGDVVITLTAYASVAWAANSVRWAAQPTGKRTVAYLAIGLVITVVLEVVNVYAFHRWTYAPAMPRLFRIGLAPMAQWVVIPLLVMLAICGAGRLALRGRGTRASNAPM